MSISQLQSYIGNINIAEDLSDEMLVAIGQRVKRQFEQDKESMQEWEEAVDNGIDLMKQEFHGKSTPWEGASNYKDPMLSRASIQFGDRASLELLRNKDLVSSEVIGKDTEGMKEASSDRSDMMMNYQINHDMNGWRKGQERMFYVLPNVGTCFKKMIHDPIEGKNESVIIQYPDFVVNQATRSMEDCRSFSQIISIPDNEVQAKERLGIWIGKKESIQAKEGEIDKAGDEGSNEDQDVLDAADNPDAYIEQQTFFDIDEDGYEEPYTITVEKKTWQPVRIIARYDERSVYVRPKDSKDAVAVPLNEALSEAKANSIALRGGEAVMGLIGMTPPEPNPDQFEMVKITPFQRITKYGFIPAPDGTFLDLGYYHLIGPIVNAINTTTNQLTDAGTLNNTKGGILSKEFRKEMGLNRLRIGEYVRTNVPADKMANGIYPNPTPEPSQTLFQLNEKMTGKGDQMLATVDISGQITAQTPPTTALMIVQEGMIPTSALFKRILDAESEEFRILYRLNSFTLDNEKYQRITDDPQADVAVDFNLENVDVSPTANAEMSTKMQRIQIATLELEQFERVLQAGGNPLPILENYFDAIGSNMNDRIFPEEGSMTEAEKQQLAQLQEAQNLSNQIQALQLEILQREQDRLDADSAVEREKKFQEIENLTADLQETLSKIPLNLEKAETEAVNNAVNIYTTQVNSVLQAIGATDARRDITANPALQPRSSLPRTIQ